MYKTSLCNFMKFYESYDLVFCYKITRYRIHNDYFVLRNRHQMWVSKMYGIKRYLYTRNFKHAHLTPIIRLKTGFQMMYKYK